MSTGEGAGPEGAGDARDGGKDRDRRPERIGVGGGDDSVTRIQLAARWAESYGSDTDSLGRVLKRFRAAYDYLDAVIHGVEPPELDRELTEPDSGQQAVPAQTPPPAYARSAPPEPAPPPPPPPPQPEPRPWG
jgi:hypothetical protein